MKQYLALLEKILAEGEEKPDRTGTGTLSLFGEQLRFDLSKGFPLLTTKRIHFHSVRTELLWLLRGDTNVAYLRTHGVRIWDEWADPETGSLGRVYGAQWRGFAGADQYGQYTRQVGEGATDQIADLVAGLRRDPHGRRHLVTAWNPSELDDMRLPPCHLLFQFYVSGNASSSTPMKLHCHLYQRSADIFLGVPFNIASYAALTVLLALELHMDVGDLIISFGDVHLYKNHIKQAGAQLSRTPRGLPSLGVFFKPGAILHRKDQIGGPEYEPADLFVNSYDPYPAIKAQVSV